MKSSATSAYTLCYHCGNEISGEAHVDGDKQFCCAGCKGVYQVLSQNNLCNYYSYNSSPGQTRTETEQHYEFLNEPKIFSQLVDYTDKDITLITFYIPAIHCSSCLWLLEHLYKLNSGISQARVDFLKKQLAVSFNHNEISLKALVELLASIGYEPLISLQDVVKEKKNSVNHSLIRKIAVAGFCMGNVMLYSFPGYLGLSSFEKQFQSLFGWLNLALAVVVTFYCGRDFFISAWGSLRNKIINLDTPLAVIIAVLFLRSAFEIISGTGPGFADTLSGLVFLLLLGRWIKQGTYNHISFNRDYRSYFPVAVTVLSDGEEKPVPIAELNIGDRILVRNNEIIPADSILMKGEGYFDFSFVTGESEPVSKVLGEIIYAGGRQLGEALEMEVIKPVSQSYLTRLWNNEAFKHNDSKIKNFNDTIARYFSMTVLLIAVAAAAFWSYKGESHRAWDAFSAVLIVACPCVLALSTPLTLSAVLGIFDRNRFYLKNTDVAEQLARIDTLVFDKTGTITCPNVVNLTFTGRMSIAEETLVASVTRNSSHPLSREIARWLEPDEILAVSSYHEQAGQGISAVVDGHKVLVGSRSFISPDIVPGQGGSSSVHISIDGNYKGFFKIKQLWRSQLKDLIDALKGRFRMHLISGDTSGERKSLEEVFPAYVPMFFGQSPHDKLNYIKKLRKEGNVVMMLGDGLNDAGALKQSDLGIAVTDNINNFTPGCDAILQGDSLDLIPRFIKHAKDAVRIIKFSFAIATVYNIAGVYFAVQGRLSPLTAAVLMPLSTVTIITFTNIANRYFAKKNRLR